MPSLREIVAAAENDERVPEEVKERTILDRLRAERPPRRRGTTLPGRLEGRVPGPPVQAADGGPGLPAAGGPKSGDER